jgi:hypothetical protein
MKRTRFTNTLLACDAAPVLTGHVKNDTLGSAAVMSRQDTDLLLPGNPRRRLERLESGDSGRNFNIRMLSPKNTENRKSFDPSERAKSKQSSIQAASPKEGERLNVFR